MVNEEYFNNIGFSDSCLWWELSRILILCAFTSLRLNARPKHLTHLASSDLRCFVYCDNYMQYRASWIFIFCAIGNCIGLGSIKVVCQEKLGRVGNADDRRCMSCGSAQGGNLLDHHYMRIMFFCGNSVVSLFDIGAKSGRTKITFCS